MRIGNYKVGVGEKVLFIGEIGINHNGSVKIAKNIIDLVSSCRSGNENVNLAVKFQKRDVDLCVDDIVKYVMKETPWGSMTYYEYKKKMEFGYDEYKEIDRYCREKELLWFASVWDVPSVDFMEQFDTPVYKIPSALLTNDKLLKHIRTKGKPVIISTGMSTIEEVLHAVDILGRDDLIVMQCNSTYPASDDELNLNVIKTYIEKYGFLTGYSGHESGVTASVVSRMLGAVAIERHITGNRGWWGTDQGASLGPPGFTRLIRDLDLLPGFLDDGVKRVYDSEKPIRDKLRGIKVDA